MKLNATFKQGFDSAVKASYIETVKMLLPLFAIAAEAYKVWNHANS